LREENWKAITKAQAVQLTKDDHELLDRVQQRLSFNDQEFSNFLILIGKISAAGVAARLGAVRLKPDSS